MGYDQREHDRHDPATTRGASPPSAGKRTRTQGLQQEAKASEEIQMTGYPLLDQPPGEIDAGEATAAGAGR